MHRSGCLRPPCFEGPAEGRREKRRGWWGARRGAHELMLWHPAWADLQLRARAQRPGRQATSGDVGGQVAVSAVSETWTEHWKNRLDPSAQLDFPLVEINLEFLKKNT